MSTRPGPLVEDGSNLSTALRRNQVRDLEVAGADLASPLHRSIEGFGFVAEHVGALATADESSVGEGVLAVALIIGNVREGSRSVARLDSHQDSAAFAPYPDGRPRWEIQRIGLSLHTRSPSESSA